MKTLNISSVLLMGLLLGESGVLSASDDEGQEYLGNKKNFNSPLKHSKKLDFFDKNEENSSTVENENSSQAKFLGDSSQVFFLDTLLENPKIELFDGKVLRVVLDDKLKNQLESERDLKIKNLTNSFTEYFEKTKKAKVSNRVLGFSFALIGDEVYCKTFLGKNAK